MIKKQLKFLKSSTSVKKGNNNKVNNNVKKNTVDDNADKCSQVLHAKKLTLESNVGSCLLH